MSLLVIWSKETEIVDSFATDKLYTKTTKKGQFILFSCDKANNNIDVKFYTSSAMPDSIAASGHKQM